MIKYIVYIAINYDLWIYFRLGGGGGGGGGCGGGSMPTMWIYIEFKNTKEGIGYLFLKYLCMDLTCDNALSDDAELMMMSSSGNNSALLALRKGQWYGAFMFSLICI